MKQGRQLQQKTATRARRRRRIRSRIFGTAARPRLVVFRSLRHIHVQLIDDNTGRTLAAVTDRSYKGTGIERAAAVGLRLAECAREKKISDVVFDRRGYQFHGQVKALADAARKAGLTF